MPRAAAEENSRISLRIRTEEKKLLLRAVALQHTDLTDFVIEQAEHAQLSGRDSLRVLDMLENPSMPNARLLAVAKALPQQP